MLVFLVSLNCTIFSDFRSLFPQYLYFQFIIFLGSNSKIFENLSWHKYDVLKMEMESLVQKYNDLLSMYTLSETSVEGRPLLVIKISTDKNCSVSLHQSTEFTIRIRFVTNLLCIQFKNFFYLTTVELIYVSTSLRALIRFTKLGVHYLENFLYCLLL